jgi:predicted GNAT superfamily acetyltransferase
VDVEITIRPARTLADYAACQQAQRLSWGLHDESYVVPVATMVGAQLHTGLVLGAFLEDGQAVGVSFAFMGKIAGRIGLYSQLTGVIPGFQDKGLGTRLKHAQRRFARDHGLDVIAWAFDPLQAGNARFNLHKLRARATRFVANMYGPRTDDLNRGVPTDRLIVEWETAETEFEEYIQIDVGMLPCLVSGGDSAADPPDVDLTGLLRRDPLLFIEIPTDIMRIRARDPERAELWRAAVNEAFTNAFDVTYGYQAVDFVTLELDGRTRDFYVLCAG